MTVSVPTFSANAFSAQDHAAMAEALRLAERGINTTTPNPRVGCVIVRDGEVVGRAACGSVCAA